MVRVTVKIKKFDCVVHQYFGPLYVTDRFRDGGGTVWCGINGADGVSYQFNASEVTKKITREEFETMPKVVRK